MSTGRVHTYTALRKVLCMATPHQIEIKPNYSWAYDNPWGWGSCSPPPPLEFFSKSNFWAKIQVIFGQNHLIWTRASKGNKYSGNHHFSPAEQNLVPYAYASNYYPSGLRYLGPLPTRATPPGPLLTSKTTHCDKYLYGGITHQDYDITRTTPHI